MLLLGDKVEGRNELLSGAILDYDQMPAGAPSVAGTIQVPKK
jgi:hypothetical protein